MGSRRESGGYRLGRGKVCLRLACFASAADSREEVKEVFLSGSGWSSNLSRLGALKRAWREADVKEEVALHPPLAASSSHGSEDLDLLLVQSAQPDLENNFIRRTGCLRILEDRVGADAVVGRVEREAVNRRPTASRTCSQALPPRIHREPRGTRPASGCFDEENDNDSGLNTTLLEYFSSLEVWCFTWALAGLFELAWDGDQVRFVHWGHLQDYVRILQARLTDFQPLHTQVSVPKWVEKVEEDFQGFSLELARSL